MGKTVLIVDDSMSIRQLVKATLLTKGYNVVDACDGVDALNKLGSQRVNLVISDVNMPNMDGITLLKAIKAKPEHRFEGCRIIHEGLHHGVVLPHDERHDPVGLFRTHELGFGLAILPIPHPR